MPEGAVQVLLVEDNEVDVEAVRRAFRAAKVGSPVHVARDGLEALELLRRRDPPFPRPYLVLLDLNMPRMNGVEFLEAIRHDPALRRSIVFVLTTSKSEEDIAASYDRNVAGYIAKEDVGEGFVDVIDLLDSYRRAVAFPPKRVD